MVRKLALAVSFALGTLSVPVHALGLGELSSKSALNQNFEADITLLSVQPEELDGVRVKLADADAFARAGVERPFYLSLLRFEPTLSGKGKAVIRVTSEFPIREPFLNFLVEVNWPNGRLLREYTVLLDPPTTTMRRPPTIAPVAKAPTAAPPRQRPAASVTPAAASAPAPAVPRVSAGASEYGPVRANETAWSIAKQVRPAGVSMEQMMMALLAANPQAFVNNNINLLRKGQILRLPELSEIQQLSRQDARNAYRAQQDAWLARRNAKLQKEVASTSTAEPSEEPAGAVATADARDRLRIASPRPEGEGEAGAGLGEAAKPASEDLDSRLILARENAEATRQEAELLRTRVDDLQARLRDMQKLLSLKDEQLAQLQDRVAVEEAAPAADVPATETAAADTAAADQVDTEAAAAPEMAGTEAADAARDTLEAATGALETVAGEAEQAKEAAEAALEAVATTEPGVGSEEGAVVIEEGAAPDDIAVPAVGMDVVGAVTEAEQPGPEQAGTEAAAEMVQEAGVAAEGEAAVVPGEEMRAEPVADEAAPVSAEQEMAAEEPKSALEKMGLEAYIPKPLLRLVEDNLVAVAAGGAALLGLLGLLFLRGRRKGEGGAEAAVAGAAVTAGAAAATVSDATQEVDEAAAVDQPAVDEEVLTDLPDSSFFDEFSPSEMNTLQDETGEVDPVSEADVYIAYGRYKQAEELLRQAMSREPDRLGLKHKLLEVHYATRNVDAFSALAREMIENGQDAADEGAWKRAQDMGRDLDPKNQLFDRKEGEGVVERAGAAVAAAGAGAAVQDDSLLLDDLELSELTAEFDSDHSDTIDLEAPSEVSITLDLEDDIPEVVEVTEPDLPESISLDEIESLDFELPEAESADITSRDSGDDISDSFDLDSMMTAADDVVDGDSALSLDSEFGADELQAELDELSDLSVLDDEAEESPRGGISEPGMGLGLVAEDSGRPVDQLDQPVSLDTAFADDTDADVEDVLELKDVAEADEGQPGDDDEVATKLDLARAYVEMGDEDGARSILQEVVAEGNQAQRGDAERLLGQIG